MDFYNTYFLTLFPTGVIFYLVAVLTLKFPPKKINHFYGYRTPRSKSSQERWDFAQEYSSRLMKILGIGLLMAALPGMYISISPELGTILGVLIVLAAVAILFLKTEGAMKEEFGDD